MIFKILFIGTSYESLSHVNLFFYIGYTFGCFFIPRFIDIYGRKWPFLLCMIVQLPLYIGLVVSRSIYLNIFLTFLMGICCVGRYNGCYINISEYVHTPYKNAVSTLLLVFEQLVAILIALYFKYFSKNWLYLQIFGVCVNFIAIIGSVIIPESPEYLYSFYKFAETRKSISWIANFNKKHFEN